MDDESHKEPTLTGTALESIPEIKPREKLWH